MVSIESGASVIELKTDIVVFGYLATHYAQYKGPRNNWGAELRRQSITTQEEFDGELTEIEWTCWAGKDPEGKDQRMGVHIQARLWPNNGGGPRTNWWIPLASLTQAVLCVEGKRVVV